MLLGEHAGEEEGVKGFHRVVVRAMEDADRVVDHAGLPEENDCVRSEPLVLEVGAGDQEAVEERSDGREGISGGELGDGEGKGDPVEVAFRSECRGGADLDDAVRFLL